MNNFNKLVAASAIALASASASADEVTAGGITWDETNLNYGISGGFQFQQWHTTGDVGLTSAVVSQANIASGDELVGVGEFNAFYQDRGVTNIFNPTVCATCELTFAFGGLVLQADNTYNADNAWLNIYFDDLTTYGDFGNFTNTNSDAYTEISDAQNGTLWAQFEIDSYTQIGNQTGSFGEFSLSITGGDADVVTELNYDVTDALSDIVMTTSQLELDPAGYTTAANGQFANRIPEPTTLAIFGLGLLGLAGAARRRKA